MKKTKTSNYFYHDKPLFGLDIGFSSIKVMQIGHNGENQVVSAYGIGSFDPSAIKDDGVIVDHEALAKAMHDLFEKGLVGEITTRRVAVSVPAARTYTRSLALPAMSDKDLKAAIELEAEQYIPVPLEELYLDYVISKQTETEINLLAVAVPKKIIDSYVQLLKIVGLEPVALETTISAASRLFNYSTASDVPTVLIDFGSKSADITIYDKALIVTGTVPCGGDIFTDLIAAKLKVSQSEAHIIKSKYGLSVSKKQGDITEALLVTLEQMLKEVRRVIRYYEERFSTGANKQSKISQIVTMGGGANMPGLSEFMTNNLRLPVRNANPWEHLDFGQLEPPNTIEKSTYVTVSGLALIKPEEIFE